MTLKADGTRLEERSTLRIAAKVLAGVVEPGWALLKETADEQFSGWTIYGPGDFTDDRLPEVGEDELVEVSFADVARTLPEVRDLHDWGNGEFPLLMQKIPGQSPFFQLRTECLVIASRSGRRERRGVAAGRDELFPRVADASAQFCRRFRITR